MKEHSFAVSVSLLFHVIVVTFFLWIPFDQYVKPKLMVLDFSIERGRMAGDEQAEKVNSSKLKAPDRNQKADLKSQQAQHEKQGAERTISRQDENIRRSAVEYPVTKQSGSDAVIDDPAGHVAVRGETGSVGTRSVNVSENKIQGGSGTQHFSSGMRVIDYGKSDSGADDFPIINETLQKRFKNSYPDRARRMGLEGEVLLNFVILQNGTVRDIEVIKDSEYKIFSDHTKDILRKTIFENKLSGPIQVRNRRFIYQLK